jgi:hypothetical protein
MKRLIFILILISLVLFSCSQPPPWEGFESFCNLEDPYNDECVNDLILLCENAGGEIISSSDGLRCDSGSRCIQETICSCDTGWVWPSVEGDGGCEGYNQKQIEDHLFCESDLDCGIQDKCTECGHPINLDNLADIDCVEFNPPQNCFSKVKCENNVCVLDEENLLNNQNKLTPPKVCEGEGVSCEAKEECKLICGNLCFNYEGTCCNDKNLVTYRGEVYCSSNVPANLGCSIPGWCLVYDKPLIVEFEVDEYYRLGNEVNNKIIITNNGFNEVNGNLVWNHSDKFEIQGKVSSINLNPGEKIEIPISVKALQDLDLLQFPGEAYSRLWLYFEKEGYFSPIMRIHKYSAPKSCGGKTFEIPGECIDDIFYPHATCDGEETGKVSDYTSLCDTGMSLNLRYDNDLDVLKTWGDVQALGNKKVLVAKINHDQNLDVQGISSWVESFYDQESQRLFGKNLIDFNFEDNGRINIDWNFIDTNEDLINEFHSKLNLDSKDYDFLIAFTDKANSKIIFNESGGVYLGQGVVLIDIGDTRFETVAHEINHGFGAPDLYYNTSYPTACSVQFFNALMCGSDSLTMLEDPVNPPFDGFNLYTNSFIGWSDLDNDGILDVEDSVEKVPSWSEGIEILDALPVLANQGTSNEQFSVQVYVLDKKTQKLVPSIITISSDLFNKKIYTPTGMMLYVVETVPSSKLDINVKAEFGGYSDSVTFEYDPSTYSYRAPKYDSLIH